VLLICLIIWGAYFLGSFSVVCLELFDFMFSVLVSVILDVLRLLWFSGFWCMRVFGLV